MQEGGGGVWGEGCRQQSQGNKPWPAQPKPSITPTPPNSGEGRAHRPPSYPRGGGRPSQELGGVGLMDGSTPQAPAPTRTTHLLSAKFALKKRSLAESHGSGSGGDGGVNGGS